MRAKKKLWRGLVLGVAAFGLQAQLHAQNWILTDNSVVSFNIKTVGLSVVQGVSNQPQSRLYFDMRAPQNASVEVNVPASSLKFSNPVLKPMILGESFFDAAQFKNVSFKSTEFVPQNQDHYWVYGELTLRGVTRPVIFDVLLRPNTVNNKLLDVRAAGTINRSDFGMKKSFGDVGEKVHIQLNGQWQIK
jgi:polyisoprenoid-binding protein YceI